MPPKHKVSTAKNLPLVKELYDLFTDKLVDVEDKPAQARPLGKFKDIDYTCFRNAFNKAKHMYINKTPPPDIGT